MTTTESGKVLHILKRPLFCLYIQWHTTARHLFRQNQQRRRTESSSPAGCSLRSATAARIAPVLKYVQSSPLTKPSGGVQIHFSVTPNHEYKSGFAILIFLPLDALNPLQTRKPGEDSRRRTLKTTFLCTVLKRENQEEIKGAVRNTMRAPYAG